MSAPDHQNSSGEQWRDDLPPEWADCGANPPLQSRNPLEIEVVKRPTVTVLQLGDSDDCWVQADHEDVLYPRDYR